MASSTPTIPEREATIDAGLDLGRLALIGTFGAPDERRALVRSARGRIARVEVGDRLLGGRVTRIDPARILIETKAGQARLLLSGTP